MSAKELKSPTFWLSLAGVLIAGIATFAAVRWQTTQNTDDIRNLRETKADKADVAAVRERVAENTAQIKADHDVVTEVRADVKWIRQRMEEDRRRGQ